ncbi:MAG: hypothetical protein N2572_08765 [Syntrophales bacterium]|nr:hypothetical protein [Syntrophales bacterium]
MKKIILWALLILIPFVAAENLCAQGMLGRPQGYSRDGKGLYTAAGFLSIRHILDGDRPYLITGEIIYSEAGYGMSAGFEIYGRIGFGKKVISGPLGPADYLISSTDLRGDDRILTAAGLRWSHPINPSLRVGLSLQGSYYLNDGTDEVLGVRKDFKRTLYEMKIKREWSIEGGMGIQIDLPKGLKAYAGPYVNYGEGKITSQPPIYGLKEKIKSHHLIGAYGGFTLPLVKRFALTSEGWYTDTFSWSCMITYTY